MHWPKISEKKKNELETLKMSLKTISLKPDAKRSPKSIAGASVHGDMISGHHGNRAVSEHNDDGKSTMTRKPIVWAENTMKPKPKEKKEGKIIDWLKEQRIKQD